MCSHSRRLTGERFARRRFFRIGTSARLESGKKSIDIDRFGQILHRAKLDRIDRRGNAGIAGQHDDAAIGIDRQQGLDQRQTRISRQVEIKHDAARWPVLRHGQGGLRIACALGIQAAPAQRTREYGVQGFVIVDDQYFFHRMLSGACF